MTNKVHIFSRNTNRAIWAAALLAIGVVGGVSGGAAYAQGASFLDTLTDGAWSLKPVGRAGAEVRSICLRANPAPLAQIEHRGMTCDTTAQTIGPREVAYTYDCGGGNNGYTRVKAETGKLVQIDTQGFKNNMPFHARYEGRWTGASCGG